MEKKNIPYRSRAWIIMVLPSWRCWNSNRFFFMNGCSTGDGGYAGYAGDACVGILFTVEPTVRNQFSQCMSGALSELSAWEETYLITRIESSEPKLYPDPGLLAYCGFGFFPKHILKLVIK